MDQLPQEAEFPLLENFKQRPLPYCQDVTEGIGSMRWALELADPSDPLQLWGCMIQYSCFFSSQCMAWRKNPSRKAQCTSPVSQSGKLQKRTSGNRWMNGPLHSKEEMWPAWKPFECPPLEAEWALSSWKARWNPAVGDLNLWALCVNNSRRLEKTNSPPSYSSSY